MDELSALAGSEGYEVHTDEAAVCSLSGGDFLPPFSTERGLAL